LGAGRARETVQGVVVEGPCSHHRIGIAGKVADSVIGGGG
jgi:hypothetical protein